MHARHEFAIDDLIENLVSMLDIYIYIYIFFFHIYIYEKIKIKFKQLVNKT